jgi:hypothetical protein
MKVRYSLVVLLLTIAVCNTANATLVSSPQVTVTQFFTFSDYGNGDVGFVVSASTPACAAGFWLRPSDPGFKTLYAQLAMAYAMKSPIRVTAYDDSIWSGSTGVYCRVYYIASE